MVKLNEYNLIHEFDEFTLRIRKLQISVFNNGLELKRPTSAGGQPLDFVHPAHPIATSLQAWVPSSSSDLPLVNLSSQVCTRQDYKSTIRGIVNPRVRWPSPNPNPNPALTQGLSIVRTPYMTVGLANPRINGPSDYQFINSWQTTRLKHWIPVLKVVKERSWIPPTIWGGEAPRWVGVGRECLLYVIQEIWQPHVPA